jgi:hypothetical protein
MNYALDNWITFEQCLANDEDVPEEGAIDGLRQPYPEGET